MINGKLSTKGILRRITALLLVLIMLISASSCMVLDLRGVASREQIEANVAKSAEEGSKNYSFVSDYLNYWQLPRFDTTKLKWYEAVYKAYYNYAEGLPDTFEHALDVAELFLSIYDNLDLTSKRDVTDALISAYVASVGDAYSVYRTASESDDYTTDMSGEFGGIGIQVEYNSVENTARIIAVFADSPAEAAGFKIGDYVHAVNGESIEEIGYVDAMDNIRGEIGTAVTVTVKRDGNLIDLTATRALVTEQTIHYEMTEEGYGYIAISGFKDNTAGQFAFAVESLKHEGAKGIIFDVRNNPGGYVHAVCEMISYLVPTGTDIMSYQYKGRPKQLLQSTTDSVPVLDGDGKQALDDKGEPVFTECDSTLLIPMVIICNEYTASSAEIFTSALRDYRNDGMIEATIVGTTTYKKGIMQSTMSYTDGSSITLTVAYYAPPSGVNYHGIGVEPDEYTPLGEDSDTQYEKAIEELEKLLNANNT